MWGSDDLRYLHYYGVASEEEDLLPASQLCGSLHRGKLAHTRMLYSLITAQSHGIYVRC